MSNQDLFGQTYTQILSKVIGGEKGNFQLVYPFMDWWWPTVAAGQISPQAYNLVNRIPQYSALAQYTPADGTVSSAYSSLLAQVNVTLPPDKVQRYNDAHDQLISAQNTWQKDFDGQYTAYTTMLGNLPAGVPQPDFDKWALSSGWTATLQADSAEIAKRQETLASLTGQENPEYAAAMKGITPPASGTQQNGWTKMDQGDGKLVPVPVWSIGKSGQDWVALLTKGSNPVTIDINAAQSSQALSQSWAGADASYGNPFWGIQASGKWNKLDLSTEDNSMTASVTLNGSAVVPVSPSEYWYNDGYLSMLAKKPDGFNSPFTATGGPSPVFGKGGILPLRITALVVGYQPGFSITMNAASFERHRQEFQASGGLRIGPFRFGGSGGHITDNWTKKVDGSTFSGQSKATYPFIMGVLLANPGGVTA